MNRVLIVDDETIVRVTLRSLIDWEANGYTIIKDCMSGQQALDYLKETPVGRTSGPSNLRTKAPWK